MMTACETQKGEQRHFLVKAKKDE